MALLIELSARLVSQGVGVATLPGRTIFLSSSAELPVTGKYIQLAETGGITPLRRQGDGNRPAYQQPSFQMVVGHEDYEVAEATIRAGYNAFISVRNVLINGVRYLRIVPVTEPRDFGVDDAGRARLVCNFDVLKEPS